MSRRTNRAIKRGLKAGGFYDTRGLYGYVHEKTGLNDRRRGIKKYRNVEALEKNPKLFISILIGSVILLLVVLIFVKINRFKIRNGYSLKNVELYEKNNKYYVKGILKNNRNKECKTGNISLIVKEKGNEDYVFVYIEKLPEIDKKMKFDVEVHKPHYSFYDPKYEFYSLDCMD